MARDRCLGEIRWIQPDVVVRAVMMQKAAMIAEVFFELLTLHEPDLTAKSCSL
jgi:hypothetical protein